MFLLSNMTALNLALATTIQLRDPAYQFDSVRVSEAKNPFKFFRAFVDYYYFLAQANKDQNTPLITLDSHTGWCVGDAHIENFAFLVQTDGKSIFTINDLDDAGPCPVIYDYFRFVVGTQLYSPNVEILKLNEAYYKGINGDTMLLPSVLEQAKELSESLGTSLSKKIKNNRLHRDSESRELTPTELQELTQILKSYRKFNLLNMRILDSIATQKHGGGSSGLQRFEVLAQIQGQLFHLELKEQITPSLHPMASDFIPSHGKRIDYTIQLEQGPLAHPLYGHLSVLGKDFLLRPKFIGNIGVEAGKSPSANDLEVIYYEAYTLGLLHRHTVTNIGEYNNRLKSLNQNEFEKLAQTYVIKIQEKFNQLKQN